MLKVKSTPVSLDFYDTLGTENRTNSIIPAILRNVNICFLVYDANNSKTFDSLSGWKKFVAANDHTGKCQFYVISNQMGHEGDSVTDQMECQTYFCDAETNYELILQNVVAQALETENYSI